MGDAGGVSAEFVPLSQAFWTTVKITDLSSVKDPGALEERITTAIVGHLEETQACGRLLVRALLEGPCPLYEALRTPGNIDALVEDIQAALHLDLLELKVDGVVRPIDLASCRNEPHVLSTALDILDALGTDDELLLRLAPEDLAGCSTGTRAERLVYLRSLLSGLDYEAAERLLLGVGEG